MSVESTERKSEIEGLICPMCNKKITNDQVEGHRIAYWNEGISRGKLIKDGWVHQECLSTNLGLYEQSYNV